MKQGLLARGSLAALAVSTLAGCTSAPVTTSVLTASPPATAATLQAYSASGAYELADLFVFHGPSAGTSPSACPTVSVENGVTVMRGGCTSGGTRNEGTIRVSGTPGAGGQYQVQYDWTQSQSARCDSGASVNTQSVLRGTATLSGTGAQRTFDLDLLLERTDVVAASCATQTQTIAIAYAGSLAFSGADADQNGLGDVVTANGAGRVLSSPNGVVQSTTRDEVFDPSRCAGEPLSGTLELRAGAHLGVLTYDGATRCGTARARTAPFTLDGVAAGELPVSACAVRHPGSRGAATAGVVGLVALALAAARRRRRG